MKAFQLLKSGATFRKDKIAPVAHLFNPQQQKQQHIEKIQPNNEERKLVETYESDKEIPQIDKMIKKLKKKVKEIESSGAGTKKEMKLLDQINEKYKHLINKRKEGVIAMRQHFKIKVEDAIEGDIPEPLDSFQKMEKKYSFTQSFMNRLKENECIKPTPVQVQAIPVLFSRKSSIILAETGSGKSLAFIAPLLHMIKHGDGLKAIVLSPTRELTIQLYKEFLIFSGAGSDHSKQPRVRFLRKALVPQNQEQFDKLCSSTEILIASPLKLAQLTEKFKINNLDFMVIDEADKLCEMGFLEQIQSILKNCEGTQPSKFLFSATMQPGIEEHVRSMILGDKAMKVQIGIRNTTASTVDQKIMYVGREDGKLTTLRQIIREGFEPPMLIFVQSKDRAKELYHELIYDGVNANVIHADRKKGERDEIMKNFRLGKIWVLICTDLMSRGVDFKTVNCVVNYDFPQSVVSYIHRVGRTGRAGRKGTAITFFTDDDVEFLRNIANLMKKSGVEVADWMLNLKAATSKRWKEIEKKPLKRKTISTDVSRNTNKRFQKLLLKDAKRLKKQAIANGLDPSSQKQFEEGNNDQPEEGWNQVEEDEQLGSDEEFASDDEEINSDEC